MRSKSSRLTKRTMMDYSIGCNIIDASGDVLGNESYWAKVRENPIAPDTSATSYINLVSEHKLSDIAAIEVSQFSAEPMD